MVRTRALGILIVGITSPALADPSVVSIDNKQQIVELASSTISTESNLPCTVKGLSINCPAERSTEKSEISSNLWMQEVANILSPTSRFDSCLQNTPEPNYISMLPLRNNISELPFNYPWRSIIPLELLSSASNLASLSNKLVDPKCILSRQKWSDRARSPSHRQLTAPKARESTKTRHSSLQNFPTSVTKFPKLSRSSLVVAFPQENSSFVPANTKLANPAPETERIASPFGWRTRPYSNQLQFHQGIDYGAPYGSPVVAVGNGIVTNVVSGCADFGNIFCGGQLGNWIEIDHGNGVIGVYGHLKNSSITVTEGMKVWKNQNIAQVGSSGWSTGAHLDFRLKIDGKHEDPAKYVMAIDPKLSGI